VPDPVSSLSAQVTHLARLAPDVVSVTMEVEEPLEYLPGQYCNVQFRGFPRDATAHLPAAGRPIRMCCIFTFANCLTAWFHGLGTTIRAGHRVRLTGPFGHAFLRPRHQGGTVLVSGGTVLRPAHPGVTVRDTRLVIPFTPENPRR